MDNKGLLEWSEYEVEKAREVLERAEAHAGELREIVRLENAELVEMAKYITYIEKLGVPRKVWMAALIMDALAVLVKTETGEYVIPLAIEPEDETMIYGFKISGINKELEKFLKSL